MVIIANPVHSRYSDTRASQVVLAVTNLPANGGRHKRRGFDPCPALEEGRATHSSILAWRMPWTEEPDGLLSIGLHRVGHV